MGAEGSGFCGVRKFNQWPRQVSEMLPTSPQRQLNWCRVRVVLNEIAVYGKRQMATTACPQIRSDPRLDTPNWVMFPPEYF